MRISVVMPANRITSFLGPALESVVNQLAVGDELIVVANGQESDQVKHFVSNGYEDSRIRIVTCREHGISNALNFGIHEARNELILRMDSDDEMLENRIALQRNWFRLNLDGILLGTQITYICAHGQKIAESDFAKHPLDNGRGIASSVEIAHPSAAFRKQAFLAAGLYREHYEPAEDLDLWLRLAKLGKVENLEESLTNYRVHNEQISKKILRRVPTAVRKALMDRVKEQTQPFFLQTLIFLRIYLRVNFLSVGVARLITESGSIKGALMNIWKQKKRCTCGNPL